MRLPGFFCFLAALLPAKSKESAPVGDTTHSSGRRALQVLQTAMSKSLFQNCFVWRCGGETPWRGIRRSGINPDACTAQGD
jgi:hypothetical protein